MTDLNLNVSPYYDDYDSSKKYIQILAVPGRAEQAREFTQLQTILLDVIKRLSGTLLREGSIVEGCEFSFNDTHLLTVEKGKIYLGGIVNDFDGGTLQLTGSGAENVGVNLVKTIITEADDASLRDPAEGFINYNVPGAHRVKAEVQLTLNDDSAPTIYKFYDGELQKDDVKPQLEILNQLLARRTFDESGNYKVEGMTIWTKDYDPNNILLTVEAGRAYVQGFEVNKPSPTRIVLSKALDSRDVTAEPKVFASGTDLYQLNNSPVKSINKVVGTVEVTSTITRGSTAGGKDQLPKYPVVSIVSVTQGATTYVANTDYQLSGDSVDWSLGGAEPAIGTSYTVVYRYNKTMVANTDYKLTTQNGNDYVDFSPAGDNPVDGTTVSVDYSYYLARYDRVYLSSNGDVKVVQGQSDRSELVKAPIDADIYRLSLGTVKLEPASADTTVDNTAVTRVSMMDLHKMLQRLDSLEYNQAFTDLDNEAMSGESPTDLKGILTDGFIGFSKSDLSHPDFSAAIDINNFELRLDADQNAYAPVVDQTATTGVTRFLGDKFFTLSYTEQALVSQLLTTGTLNVNPYNAFQKLPILNITPEEDNWIDKNSVTIDDVTTVIRRVIGYWNRRPDQIENTGTITRVIQTILPYTRQIEIAVSGENLPYNADVEGYIDGVKVSLTPTGSYLAGSTEGTIKTDAVGKVTGQFLIPSGIRTGAREVLLKSGEVQASAIFTSEGIQETTQTTVLQTKIVTETYDPLAQSFQLSENRFVSSVELYFSNKSTTDSCTIQVRNMDNGYPGNEILAEKKLDPSAITVSADGSLPTKVTFDTPVFCEKDTQYCFVIATTSQDYALHIATMGKNQLSGGTVSGQPYLAGVLFTSSNALTWTAQQDSDLKFAINGASFGAQGTLQFNFVTGIDVDSLVALIDFDIYEGTTCTWEYQTEVNGGWLPLEVYGLKTLNSTITMIAIRANLKTLDPTLSPVISGDKLNILGLTTSMNSSYISRLVTTSQDYTTVKQIFEASVPSGSTVEVQLSTDDSTWVSGTLSSSETIDNDFTQYTYQYTIPNSGTSTSFRARLNLSTTNRVVQPRVRKLMNIIK